MSLWTQEGEAWEKVPGEGEGRHIPGARQEQLLSSGLSLGECVCRGQDGGPALWLVQGEWAAVAELGSLLSPLTPQHVQVIVS